MKHHMFTVLVMTALLLTACGGVAATSNPQSGEIPATEYPSSLESSVVILVVDDFALPSVDKLSLYKDSGETENCILTPDGQRFGATGAGLTENPMDIQGDSVAHGDTVFDDLKKQGGLNELSLGDGNPSWLKRLAEVDTDNGKLIIAGVDTDGYTTASVAKNLSAAIDAFTGNAKPITFIRDGRSYATDMAQNIVVNMSFSIIPCNTTKMSLDEYQNLLHGDDPSFAMLESKLADNSFSPEQAQTIVSMASVYKTTWYGDQIDLSGDPLYDKIRNNEGNIVYVASAGNLGKYDFYYPFAPAIWDFVISVSSEAPQNGESTEHCSRAEITDYSNCGEIRDNGISDDNPNNYGTSYAAPKVSYQIAKFIMQNKISECTAANSIPGIFGYADISGNWENMSFQEAIETYCQPASQPAASTGGTTLKIVSSLPMTGSSQSNSQSIVNAMQMRVEQANYQACGGRYTLQYEAWDDASAERGRWDPNVETENAYKAAADLSIIAYLGTFNSDAAKLSIPILNQAGPLVMISPANTNSGLTKADRDLSGVTDSYYPTGIRSYARVVAADDVQGTVAANFMRSLGVNTVYILDDQELYSRNIADAFESAAWRNGLTVLGHEGIDPKAMDYKDLMIRIALSNNGSAPDAIYASVLIDNNAPRLLQDKVDAMGDNAGVIYVGPGAIQDQYFIDVAGSYASEGVYASGYDIPLYALPPAGQQFISDYETRYGLAADIYAVYGYETMNVTLKAIEDICAAGGDPTNRETIRAAVFAIGNFDGVLGNWSFDANGDISLTDMEFFQVQNGSFVSVGVFK